MARRFKPTAHQGDVLNLFNINWDDDRKDWRPLYGSSALLPLRNQPDPGRNGLYRPSTDRMLLHLDLISEVRGIPDLWEVIKNHGAMMSNLMTAYKLKFERLIIAPIRRQLLRFGLYFLRSKPKQLDFDKKGRVVIQEESKEPEVLKILAMSTQIAHMRGAGSKKTLQLMAPEILDVLRKIRQHKVILDEEKLLGYVDSWMPYIPDLRMRKQFVEEWQLNRPLVAGKRFYQLVLPELSS